MLVTAGPGLTNAVTGIAGAWQESRELLVIGGQVKSSDLSRGLVRQRGIQEIDGVVLVSSLSKRSIRIEQPLSKQEIVDAVLDGRCPRQGPVFLEFCLDAQAAAPLPQVDALTVGPELPLVGMDDIRRVADLVSRAVRPILLIGGGVSRNAVRSLGASVVRVGIPLMTTWNGADRVPSEHPLYAGRPNTWGQRAANVLIQQADLVVAIGTRLGLQQTGFAWEQFVPVGTVVQVDLDETELQKGHPRVDVPLRGDADRFLIDLVASLPSAGERFERWMAFVREVEVALPLAEPANRTGVGFVEPYAFAMALCSIAGPDDLVLPGSSGGAATVSMQALRLRARQKLVGDKSLASMGYGLSGAIGAALANPGRRVFLTEGDGGFAQNSQELGTLVMTGLPVKIFLMANDGYASIRMTQRNYFAGAWIGCDTGTGLGLPDWRTLAAAYGVAYVRAEPVDPFGGEVADALGTSGPALIEVPIDPHQTYFPKITSTVQRDGSMRSNPLHLMDPPLDEALSARVMPYLQ